MADKERGLNIKIEDVSFEEDPLKFCQEIYAEANGRYQELKPTNVENRLFFEGKDRLLDARNNDSKVKRSAIFIHQMTPAIDTRLGGMISRLEEKEFPITVTPRNMNPEQPEKDAAFEMQRRLNHQMRECGYLTDIFYEHSTATEIYHTPSALKVDWENVYEKTPVVIKPSIIEMVFGKKLKVKFVDKYKGGRPTVEYLHPGEFLYEPFISIFNRDSRYALHAMWLPYHELVARAKEHNYDMKKIEAFRDEITQSENDNGTGKTASSTEADEVAVEMDIPYEKGYNDDKFLLVENYVVVYDDTGGEEIRLIVTVGDKHIVKNTLAPHKGIKFPFVPAVANRLPGTIEGLSSVDRAKFAQRLFNEIFNSYLDGVSYRIFPPLKAPNTLSFKDKPIWEPGAIFRVNEPDQLVPLVTNPGNLPDLPALMEAVGGMIRDLLNAQDISQGFQSQQYEKATSTKLRAMGSERRATPTYKRYGETIIEVARQFIALNQQYAEDAEFWVQDVIIDVPSLTNVSDPEAEKQERMLLLGQAVNLPIFQNPMGHRKIAALWNDTVDKFVKVNRNDFKVSEAELEQFLQAQKEMQLAQIEKESAGEQLALEQQSAPPQEQTQTGE